MRFRMRSVLLVMPFSFSFLAHSVVCCKSFISAFLSALFADKSHVDSCDGRRPFFADNFGAAEIILLAKMGKQKLREAIFSVRCSRRFFSRPQNWAEKRSEFFGPSWPKKGVQPKLSAGAFYLCTSRSDVKGAKTLLFGKSNRNAPLNPDFGV